MAVVHESGSIENAQVEDLGDRGGDDEELAAGTVETDGGEAAPDLEPPADDEAGSGEAGDSEPGEVAAEEPAADPMVAKYEAQIAELQKEAALAAEFKPYANELRALIKRGLTPEQAREQIEAQTGAGAQGAQKEPEYVDPWDEKQIDGWWDRVTRDGKHLRDTLYREVERHPVMKKLMDRLEAAEKWQKERTQHIDAIRGKEMVESWKQKNPADAKHADRALEFAAKGIPWNNAIRIAKGEALLAAQEKAAAAGGVPGAAGTPPVGRPKKPTPPVQRGVGSSVSAGKNRLPTGVERVGPPRAVGARGSGGGSIMREALRTASAALKKGRN